MNKKKIWICLLGAAAGAILFYVGGFVLTSESLKSISGMCIGLGAALFCLGAGGAIDALIVSKTERGEMLRKKEIEVHDERNVTIRQKVGATTNRVLVYALSAVILALGFMGEGIVVIAMVSSLLLLELILAVALTGYYSKRM